MITIILIALLASFLLLLLLLGMGLLFGGPSQPEPMASIFAPFKNLDYSQLPALQHCHLRDRIALAYRQYPAQANHLDAARSIVFVHGSSASSNSMHVLAQAFAQAGYTAYTLDMRGHGGTGTKGHIDYIGQLEDDLVDFVGKLGLKDNVTLAGFSSGGGFVLRFAGSRTQHLFRNYLLMSPFISQTAASFRPNSGGWVKVGIPRVVALLIMNAFGLRFLNFLPVTRFALSDEAKQTLTPFYGFNLAQNFRPMADYHANILACQQPMGLVAGQADEAFFADQFAPLFEAAGKAIPVTLVPGIGHVALTLEPAGTQACLAMVERLYS